MEAFCHYNKLYKHCYFITEGELYNVFTFDKYYLILNCNYMLALNIFKGGGTVCYKALIGCKMLH